MDYLSGEGAAASSCPNFVDYEWGKAENELECRWGRKQLLDFYCEILERGAGTLTPEDRLFQVCEETTVIHYNGMGEPVRTVHNKRPIMLAKVEAADGIRKMLGWDKVVKAGEPEDDITELLGMIRRRSGHGELGTTKPSEVKPLPEKTESRQMLETLSSEHLEPLPQLPSTSVAATTKNYL